MALPSLIVIAKAPLPGRAKTRLCPPCEPAQAAALAEAALADTLAAVRATPAERHVVALDGEPGGWLPHGFEVIGQRTGGLGERLAGAFADVGGPAFLVGMDTPQLAPALLQRGLDALGGASAVLGPASDGGYWSIGLHRSDPAVFAGVPMSSARTGAEQAARLDALGLDWVRLPELRDVDTFDDAVAVAAEAPGSRFAATLDRLEIPAAESASPAA